MMDKEGAGCREVQPVLRGRKAHTLLTITSEARSSRNVNNFSISRLRSSFILPKVNRIAASVKCSSSWYACAVAGRA